MALPPLVLAAIERLRTFYNGGIWVPASPGSVGNPGGFDGDGHAINFVPALRDVATAGQAVADAAASIGGNVEAAAESADAAAQSAQDASDSADRAAQFDPTTYAPKNSPALTGNPTAPTPAAGDNDASIATTAFVQAAISGLDTRALILSQALALTGTR